MRLGRLAVAGLTVGLVAGFAIALLRPRRRPQVVDLTGTYGEPVTPVDEGVGSGVTSIDISSVEAPVTAVEAP